MEEENKVLEETETYPIDGKRETIHFPWFIALVMAVLMVVRISIVESQSTNLEYL